MIRDTIGSGPTAMPVRRYIELDLRGGGLTQEELDAGWHFCYDWDGMLVGPGMPETEICVCGARKGG
jgi:hypothetical protein